MPTAAALLNIFAPKSTTDRTPRTANQADYDLGPWTEKKQSHCKIFYIITRIPFGIAVLAGLKKLLCLHLLSSSSLQKLC